MPQHTGIVARRRRRPRKRMRQYGGTILPSSMGRDPLFAIARGMALKGAASALRRRRGRRRKRR